MSPEEKGSFRLSPGLGSPSRTIYQRIIKKIYGVEKGLEIIELLHNNPAQTVPIVLKRLKQKDDEWKRAQREWNKIWREVEAKNYWKSLDYQGITFKMTDRKAMTTRSLVAQAEAARSNENILKTMNSNHEETSKYHFSYSFKDVAVFKDVSRLIYFYLDRQPVYNPEDCESMRIFMNTMIPMFFDVTDVEPSTVDTSAEIILEEEDDRSDVQSVDSDAPNTKKSTANSRSARRARRGRGQLNDDDGLRKDVLTRNLNKRSLNSSDEEDDEEDEDEEDEEDNNDDGDENASHEEEEENEQDDDDDDDDEEDDDEEQEIQQKRRPRRAAYRRTTTKTKKPSPKKKATPPKIATVASLIEKEKSVEPENQKTYNFFGDNGYYCFFRLYQVLYDRLCKMKALDAEFRKNPKKAKKATEEAQELGITPRRFRALKMDTKRGYYNLLLVLIDKLFEGDVDQQTFEECVRYIFGGDAYIMFTIDKLVLSLVRHVSAMV